MSDPLRAIEQAPAEQPAQAPTLRLDPRYLRMRTGERKTAEYRQFSRLTADKWRYRHYVRGGLPMDVMRRTRRFAIRHMWWLGPLAYVYWRGWR